MTAKERAAALVPYIRQSRKKEVSISVDSQRDAIRAWAKAAGVDLLPEVVEEGVSGSRHWRKRELGRVIEACEEGRAGGIVVAYQDRLSRENGLGTAEVWEALQAARNKGMKARLVAACEGLDTDTGDHELLFTIKAAIAREQWKRFKANWSNAQRRHVEAGGYISAQVPVGYDRVPLEGARDGARGGRLVPNSLAPAVRELFQMRAAGASWGECRRMLEGRGVPNGSGTGPWWTARAMRHVVSNRCYLGESRFGELVNERAHEAIVDSATWRAAQRKGTARGVRTAPRSLLGGIAYCAGCGRKMSPMQGGRYYQCRSSRNYAAKPCEARASCLGAELDAAVSEAFLLLIPHHFAAGPPPADLEPLERELAEARNGLDALQRALETAAPEDVPTLAAAAPARRLAVEGAEEALRLAQLGSGLAREAGTIQQRWERMEVEERRKWLRLWGFRVEVERGRKPVADRATLSWEPQPLRREEVVPATIRDLLAEAEAEAGG